MFPRPTSITRSATERAGLAHGGIGAMHLVARQTGLIDAIDRRLHLLKIHLPYHESDHVLNLAYNALCGAPVCKIWNCVARTKSTLTLWGRNAF